MTYEIKDLIKRYPGLEPCSADILKSLEVLEECFSKGHKLLLAGNGGSCADADHIVGELMKSFKKCRKLDSSFKEKLIKQDSQVGEALYESLQQGLPAIALHNHNGLNTAYINDVEKGGEFMYSQQVFVYGQEGDVFLGISTSGNSKNVYAAALAAKAKGIKVIGLTGCSGGKLSKIADVAIKAPADETFIIQEYHLPIYHFLCLKLEEKFFK